MSDPFLPTHLREAVDVARAADDLRRHLPVVFSGETGACLVFPAEMAENAVLARLRGFGAPRLVISRERAAVLKIRHKGRSAVALACRDDMTPADIRAVADPTADLATPLKGPFAMLEEGEAAMEAAALGLLREARLVPAALAVPLADPHAAGAGLLAVTASAVEAARESAGVRLEPVASARLPLEGAPETRIVAFRPETGGLEHFALLIGDPAPSEPVLVRLHSECFTGDALGSLKCDCGSQFRGALAALSAVGGGVLLYLAQEGRGIGLVAKLKAYALQDQGYDTVDANLRLGFAADEREFAPAAAMLRALGFARIRLLTNNPQKVKGLETEGIRVVERVAHAFPATEHSAHYLATKRDRSGHFL